jgi:hypothetical protein
LLWYNKAAYQGESKAELNLGVMYENGRGVEKDFGEAESWYRKAIAHGDEDAQQYLNNLESKRQASASAAREEESRKQARILAAQQEESRRQQAAAQAAQQAETQRQEAAGLAAQQAQAEQSVASNDQQQSDPPQKTKKHKFGGFLLGALQAFNEVAPDIIAQQQQANAQIQAAQQAQATQQAAARQAAAEQAAQQRAAAQQAAAQRAAQLAAAQKAAYKPPPQQSITGSGQAPAGYQYPAPSILSNVPAGGVPASPDDPNKYLAGVWETCVKTYYDPNEYKWFAFADDCGIPIYVVFHSINGSIGGAMDLAPGRHTTIGWGADYVESQGGIRYAVCPKSYVPVELTTDHFLSRAEHPYRCKYQP